MKKNGFTLVEIMIVVAIVGILATMATLAIRKSIENSHMKHATVELDMITAAVLQLAWDTGRWPNGQKRTQGGTTEIWNISPASCGLLSTDGSYNEWKGPYYEGSINDPWGNPYFFDPDYMIDGVNRAVVGSLGPDGIGRNNYRNNDNIYIRVDD
jgi:general secretion pathway protein G